MNKDNEYEKIKPKTDVNNDREQMGQAPNVETNQSAESTDLTGYPSISAEFSETEGISGSAEPKSGTGKFGSAESVEGSKENSTSPLGESHPIKNNGITKPFEPVEVSGSADRIETSEGVASTNQLEVADDIVKLDKTINTTTIETVDNDDVSNEGQTSDVMEIESSREQAETESDSMSEPKTRKQLRAERKKEKQELKEQKIRKPRGRIRLIPVWIKVIIFLCLIAGSLVAGAIVGFGIVGEGEVPLDILEKDTWYHLYDLIYQDTELDRSVRDW